MRRRIIAFNEDWKKVITSLTQFKSRRELVFCIIDPQAFVKYKADILMLLQLKVARGLKKGIIAISYDNEHIFISEIHNIRDITWDTIEEDIFISFSDGRPYRIRTIAIFKSREFMRAWLEEQFNTLEEILGPTTGKPASKAVSLLEFLR